MRTYLAKHGEKFRKIAFFCTCGGDSGNAFEEMESLCGKKPLATLELTKAEVMREEHLSKARAFVDEISVGG